jgi:hypothetical protein
MKPVPSAVTNGESGMMARRHHSSAHRYRHAFRAAGYNTPVADAPVTLETRNLTQFDRSLDGSVGGDTRANP